MRRWTLWWQPFILFQQGGSVYGTSDAGCIPDLGWEQSGGEIVPAAAGIVYRLLERRRAGARPGLTGGRLIGGARSGTGPAPTGPLGGILCWLDTLPGKNEQGGETGRGVAGAQPLHKGGPKAGPPKGPGDAPDALAASHPGGGRWRLGFQRPSGLRDAANLGPEALPAKRWRRFGNVRWTEATMTGAPLRSWTLQQPSSRWNHSSG